MSEESNETRRNEFEKKVSASCLSYASKEIILNQKSELVKKAFESR